MCPGIGDLHSFHIWYIYHTYMCMHTHILSPPHKLMDPFLKDSYFLLFSFLKGFILFLIMCAEVCAHEFYFNDVLVCGCVHMSANACAVRKGHCMPLELE